MNPLRAQPPPLHAFEIGAGDGRERPLKEERFLDGRLVVRSPRGVGVAERLLLEALDEKLEGRILVIGSAGGLVAMAAQVLLPDCEVVCWHADAYQHVQARRAIERNRVRGPRCVLAAELPGPERFDAALVPCRASGESALQHETVHAVRDALKPRGKVVSAIDNDSDHWLRRRLEEVFGPVTERPGPRRGILYVARKRPGAAPRPREFRRRFQARLFGREIEVETRPGIFSHGEIDEGTMALAEVAAMDEVGAASAIVDLGCGSGALGIAAALAAPRGRVLLVDSNLRAAALAQRNAIANGAAARALAVAGFDLAAVRPGSIDLALANPPYYSDFRISEIFIAESFRVLKPGGALYLVTKARERHEAIFAAVFGASETTMRRGYAVIKGRKRRSGPPRR
jgi:16S rRNA (guanine1207-N2)-methyltransferase